MKKIIIYSNEFSVPDNSYSFLSKYLDRIRKFINSNSLDIDLLNDIEERISEKFFSITEGGKEISEKDVIDIVNEIGEPEDIFKDFINKKETTNTQNSSEFSQKVKSTLKAKLYKNSKKGIIFGVCQGFGEYFEINPIWIRILFLFLFFFYGTGIFIYIILGILLPEKDEELGLDIEKNVHKAAERVKEVANQGFIINFFNAIGKFIMTVFTICGRFIGFFFFGILGLGLLFSGIMGVIASAFVNNSYIINNENVFSYIPTYFVQSSLVFSVIIFILGIIAIFGAFNKKLVNGYVILTALILLAFSGFGITSGIFKTMSNYVNSYSKIEKFDLGESGSGNVVKLGSINQLLGGKENFLHFCNERISLKILKSDTNKISVEIISAIRANNKISGDEVLSKLKPLNVKLMNNEIVFSGNSENYNSIVPFSFLTREIILHIPTNISLDLREESHRNYNLDDSNIRESEEMVKYNVHGCYYSIIKYEQGLNQFICNDIDGINNAKIREKEEE